MESRRSSRRRLLPCLALAALALAGCGDRTAPEATQSGAGEPEAAAAAEPAADSEDFWADIPVYPDAGRADEVASAAAQARQMGEYEAVEFRYWETGADVGTVADFYLAEMPENGWTNVLKMDFGRPESAMSAWTKGDGAAAANVSVGRDASGTTYISVVRGQGAS